MFVVLLEFAVHGGTEPTTPRPPLHHVLDDGIGMRTCPTPVCRLVVLVEGVGTPETLVAIGAGILAPSFVKLLLVSLPVEFTLEGLVA
jgi:hypothetical protein